MDNRNKKSNLKQMEKNPHKFGFFLVFVGCFSSVWHRSCVLRWGKSVQSHWMQWNSAYWHQLVTRNRWVFVKNKPWMTQNWLSLFNLIILLLSREVSELSKPAGNMRPNKTNFSTVFPSINTKTTLLLGHRNAVIMLLVAKQSLWIKGNSRQLWFIRC